MRRPALRVRGLPENFEVQASPMVKIEPPPKVEYIKPILELEAYLWLQKRHGASPKRLDELRRMNTRGDPLNRVVTYRAPVYMTEREYRNLKPPRVTRLPVRLVNDVVFSFEVINDRVVVSVVAPFDLAFQYIRRGQKVPKHIQIACLRKCGVYPEDFHLVRKQLKNILGRPVFKSVKKMPSMP